MATATQLQKFTDFDRLLKWKNFIVTLLGSIAAFSLSYFSETIVDISDYAPPYGLSFTFAAIIIVAVYCRNIASAGIVGLSGGIGVVSPHGDKVDWALSYIVIVFLISLLLAMLANKLLLVKTWIKLHLTISLIFVTFLMGLSVSSHPEADEYTTRGIDLAVAGEMDSGLDLPVTDFVVSGVLIFLMLIIFLLIRKPMILDRDSILKYDVFGALFLLLGQAISFIMLLGLTKSVRENDINEIARDPYQLRTVGDLFSHKATGDAFAIVVEPFSIYAILAVVTVFTSIGLSLLSIAEHKGNVEGMRGGSDIAYLAAPIALMLFHVGGSYYLQNFMYEGGFFISVELFVMYSTMIWAVFVFNQTAARLVLFLLDRILPQK